MAWLVSQIGPVEALLLIWSAACGTLALWFAISDRFYGLHKRKRSRR